MFEPFGEITSCKVSSTQNQQDPSKKEFNSKQSSGFGFVCFNSPDDARKAFEHFQNREGEPEESKEDE